MAVAVVIPTGEVRTAERDAFGSWACPWCGSCVASPEHPTVIESGHYSDSQRRAWESLGCGNPWCFARVDPAYPVSEIERIRVEREARERDEAERKERHARIMRNLQDERNREADVWTAARAEAERRGACVECLRASDWRSFRYVGTEHESLAKRVRFVRHRGECPREVERQFRAESARGR